MPENQTNAPISVLERLAEELEDLTPEARKAARYVLENPRDIGFLTVREAADAAKVKPNTILRMARQIGFVGYDDFREPFREAIRDGQASLPDRARWLQQVQKRGEMGRLVADMAISTMRNIEEMYASLDEEKLSTAAQAILDARKVYTLGVGVNNTNANNFTYLASIGLSNFHAIPRPGMTSVDDLTSADSRDVLIAITSRPYRSEVVTATQFARQQGITVIALTDSPASPIARHADLTFNVAMDTPQFFPSSVSTLAFLETLLSFVVAAATDEVVENVDKFHECRYNLGFYHDPPS